MSTRDDDRMAPIFDAQPAKPELPYNIPAEQALLGVILLNNDALYRVSNFLEPEHFFEPVHGDIFMACRALIADGMRADPVVLAHRFDRHKDLQDHGGAQYLARLAASHMGGLSVELYGATIHDLWRRRELIQAATQMLALAYDKSAESSATQMLHDGIADLSRIADGGPEIDAMVSLSDAWNEALAHSDAVFKGTAHPGLATGLRDLDAKLNGLQPGDLCTLAGRTSMGKTALALAIADRVASRGERVLFFSMEMSARQLAYRAGASRTRLPASVLARPTSAGVMVDAARVNMSEVALQIDPTPALTHQAIRARTERIHRRTPVSLVVVDHIGMMRPTHDMRTARRVEQLGDVTKNLKALAKDVGCPVIALSQLNREVEKRDGNRPTLADLRDSGNIEEDSDQVLFVFREEYYLNRATPADDELMAHAAKLAKAKNIMEVIVAKNRNGATDTARLYCNIAANDIGNLVTQEEAVL